MRFNLASGLLALFFVKGIESSLLRGASGISERGLKEAPLIYLDEANAVSLFRSKVSNDYFIYHSGWDAPISSVASIAALLNSLLPKEDLPVDPKLSPYPYATQEILVQANTDFVNKNVVLIDDKFNGIENFPYGLSLPQAQQFIQCQLPQNGEYEVSAVQVDDLEAKAAVIKRERT